MMKKFLLILTTVILATAFSCSVHTRTYQTENEDTYLIKKIKKKNDWYFIYAAKNDKIFLICSPEPKDKALYACYPKIQRHKRYNLSLRSRRYAMFDVGGEVNMWSYKTTAFQLDSITWVYVDRKSDGYYIGDLFFTYDLEGLYYVREKQ